MPLSIDYQIRIIGEKNKAQIDSVCAYLDKENSLVKRVDDVITVREDSIQGLVDYMQDHMDLSEITYRIAEGDWSSIQNVSESLDLQWIDKIIFNEEVVFHIQPIVDVEEQIYAHEMLARFKDENGIPLAPYPVFTAAKKRNRTYALDRVCRLSAVRNSVNVVGKVFINFIPTSIYSPEHCLRSTVQLAEELEIDPGRFVFEVVETEEVDDIEHLKSILAYYRKKGFNYALDDVGEGFSTVEVLEELKPHYMKLDMKFVRGISSDLQKQLAAKKILNAAIKVGSIPLAEGVEDRVDFDWLKAAGFKLFQGYLFGKPAPIPAT